MKKTISLLLALCMTASTSVFAEKGSVVNFDKDYQTEVIKTTSGEVTVWNDSYRGYAVMNPNYTKEAGLVLNTDFSVIGNCYAKIRYYLIGTVNDGSYAVLKSGDKEHRLYDYTGKASGKWHTEIVNLDGVKNTGEMTFIPVNNPASWSSNADIYIDYIGFFATEAEAKAYTEGDDDDSEVLTIQKNTITATGEQIQVSVSQVEYLAGYSEKYFKPDNLVSRAEAAAMISRIITAELKEEELALSDVTEGKWYYEDVKKLADNGIVESEGNFRPSDALTRRELARMLKNLGVVTPSQINSFTDIDVKDKDFLAICSVANSGLMVGDELGRFLPEDVVTRAQITAVLNRLLNVDINAASEKLNPYLDVKDTHWAYLHILASTSTALAEDGEGGAGGMVTIDGVKYDVYNSKNAVWEPVLMRSQEIKDKGLMGGEGAQYQTHIVVDHTGQNLATFSDAGQIYISKDAGATWVRGGRDMEAATLATGEFDPNNSNRIIGYVLDGTPGRTGQPTYDYTGKGIYISEDMGTSFESTSFVYCDQMIKTRIALAWDPTSYDKKINGSSICYFTTNTREFSDERCKVANDTYIKRGFNEGPGLYRSDDGGYTWKLINDQFGGTTPAVSYSNGYVFIAAHDGLYRSTDKGELFEKVIDGKITGVTTIHTYPDNVYACGEKGIYVSTNNGDSFQTITSGTYPTDVMGIEVSPANPDRIILSHRPDNMNNAGLYVSHDGGASWVKSEYDKSDDFYAHQEREKIAAWHPTDENKVWSFSDWVESSTDGGMSFKWDANGQGSSCIQAPIVPNIHNPDIWIATAQDYGGAVTLDGGDTWQVLHTPEYYAGGGKGHIYGGYAVDENTWFVTSTSGWEQPHQDLMMTTDGGKTWTNKGNTSYFRTQKAMQAPADPNVFFATDLRSGDAGANWEKMPYEIRQVSCFNPEGDELFAQSNTAMYISTDTGKTWEKLFDAPATPENPGCEELLLAAYDHINDILYFAQADKISKYQNGKIERLDCPQMKNKWVTILEVDPRHPNVIYACGTPNGSPGFDGFSFLNGIIRSCDGGATWQVISSDSTEGTIVKDGPVVGNIPCWAGFVHPETGEFVVGQPNWGLAKFPAPYEN